MDNGEGLLTTEQVIELAQDLPDGEEISVETNITPFLHLEITATNAVLDSVDAILLVDPVEGMNASMPISAYYSTLVPEPEGVLESYVITPPRAIKCNIWDIAKLFRLSKSPLWEVTNHGVFIG